MNDNALRHYKMQHYLTPFLLLLSLYRVSNGDTRVDVQMGGTPGSSCYQTLGRIYVAGSKGLVTVRVTSSDNSLVQDGFELTKPSWLDIEFSFAGREGEPFIPSKTLSSLLNPRYFLTEQQEITNKRIQNGEHVDGLSAIPIYYFAIDYAEQLIGSTICIRAVLNSPPFGRVEKRNGTSDRNLNCIHVVPPCSSEDSTLAIETRVSVAMMMQEYELAIDLADSLINDRLLSATILEKARLSAQKAGEFETALHFLDVSHEKFGESPRTIRSDVPPFEQIEIGTQADAEEAYLTKRSWLLEAIATQKHQR